MRGIVAWLVLAWAWTYTRFNGWALAILLQTVSGIEVRLADGTTAAVGAIGNYALRTGREHKLLMIVYQHAPDMDALVTDRERELLAMERAE